jgi:predicted DNA-binding protein
MYDAMYSHQRLFRYVTIGNYSLRKVGPMARKKISTTIYITSEQNDKLKLLHERTKVPIAVFIREGIDLVLERYVDELPGQLSLAESITRKKSTP